MTSTKAKPALQNAGAAAVGGAASSPVASPRASMTSPKSRLSANISRPDDVNSLAKMTSKWSKNGEIKAAAEVARPKLGDDEDGDDDLGVQLKSKVFTTPSGETCISKKEEALEQIMCAEAFATFERTARHQLNYATANRTTVDPDKIGLDIDVLSQFYLDGS